MAHIAVYILSYFCILVFVLAVIFRYIKINSLPLQVRWELYPVAHEGDRTQYGGSYMEESDWWTKPIKTSKIGELKVMIPEILFLVALYEHNRKLWYRSFPFHFGLYLLVGAIFFTVINTVTSMLGCSQCIYTFYISKFMLYGGLGLSLIGTLGLLHHRLFNEKVKRFTNFSHIFNLLLFLVTLLVVSATLITDPQFIGLRLFAYGLLSFKFIPIPSILNIVAIALTFLLIAYIPLTHMSHFVAKWFTYHKIRWDDTPYTKENTSLNKKMQNSLGQKVTWSAKHIKADGKKNWVDLAIEGVSNDDKK